MPRATTLHNVLIKSRNTFASALFVALTALGAIAFLSSPAAKPKDAVPHQTSAQVVQRYLPALEFAAVPLTTPRAEGTQSTIDTVSSKQRLDALPLQQRQQHTEFKTQTSDMMSL